VFALIWYPIAALWCWMHCALRHGVDPTRNSDDLGTSSLRCSVCGRVFWRRRRRPHGSKPSAHSTGCPSATPPRVSPHSSVVRHWPTKWIASFSLSLQVVRVGRRRADQQRDRSGAVQTSRRRILGRRIRVGVGSRVIIVITEGAMSRGRFRKCWPRKGRRRDRHSHPHPGSRESVARDRRRQTAHRRDTRAPSRLLEAWTRP
jgi:hypothetical protein